jgi:hypothetical protein
MHRTFEIVLEAEKADELCRNIAKNENVINVSIQRGASVKPPGDIVTVHLLSRAADDVLREIQNLTGGENVSIATSELTSIIDKKHNRKIDDDVDEAIWEEMETGLRHQGHITANYLALMALGGGIAAVGLISESAPQAVAFIAASIIAPGFEPLAKTPLAMVLRNWNLLWHGLLATLVGYGVLIAAAFLAMGLMSWTGSVGESEFVKNSEVENLSHPKLKEYLVPLFSGVAGMVMIAAYRRNVIAGPLIGLVLIPAAAMIGASLTFGRTDFALEAAERFLADVGIVVGTGLAVFFIKQIFQHQRKPIV